MKDILTFVEQKVRRICSLEVHNYELDGDLTNSEIENDKLKKQIEEITDKLNESNRDLKVLTKQLDEQFSLSEMLKSKVVSKQELIDFQNQRISDYIISVNDLDSTNNLLKQEINRLRELNKKHIEEIERKDILLNDTELTIQSFTSNKESFDKLSIENQELKQENESLRNISESNKYLYLRNKLKNFFEDLLISEDIEDLLNRIDYEKLSNTSNPEKLTPDSIINHFLLWEETNKKHDYWESIFNKLYNMEVKKQFVIDKKEWLTYHFYFEIKEKVELNISKEERQEKALNEEVYIIEMKIDFDNKFIYYVSNSIDNNDAFLYGFTKSQLNPINID